MPPTPGVSNAPCVAWTCSFAIHFGRIEDAIGNDVRRMQPRQPRGGALEPYPTGTSLVAQRGVVGILKVEATPASV